MNGILGMTEMVLDTQLTEQQAEFLGVAKVSAVSLLNLLNDLLDFSKIDAGKLELCPAPFSLRQELEEVVRPLASRASAKGLELIYQVDADVPDEVEGDAVRLRQLLVNLVSNAVKFTHQGSITFRVSQRDAEQRLAHESLERGLVRIHFTVSDTGIGIPAEKFGVIFNPFVQADGSLARKYTGSGLGLSIAARLVEMMGGQITLESEVGRGSTFEFTLSFLPRGGESQRPASRAPSNGNGTAPVSRPARRGQCV